MRYIKKQNQRRHTSNIRARKGWRYQMENQKL